MVIDIHAKVEKVPGNHCTVDDLKAWEKKRGRIPAGAVVRVRSDWHKKWTVTARFLPLLLDQLPETRFFELTGLSKESRKN